MADRPINREEELLEVLQGIRPEEVEPPKDDDDKGPEQSVVRAESDTDTPQAVPPISKSNTITLKSIFSNHDAHPLILDMILLNKYGVGWLGWESETLLDEIKDDFQVSVSNNNWNKIQAVKTCHVVDSPWIAWEVFVPICQSLNNNTPDFRTLYKPSYAQIIYSVDVMNKIKEFEFSDEVSSFIAACFLDDYIYYLPSPVDFAQKAAAMLQYKCKDCGFVDVDNDNDMCDSCHAPQSRLKKIPTWDPAPVEKRYKKIVSQGDNHDVLQETVVDVQVAKLLVSKNYIMHRQKQFVEQAKVIAHV